MLHTTADHGGVHAHIEGLEVPCHTRSKHVAKKARKHACKGFLHVPPVHVPPVNLLPYSACTAVSSRISTACVLPPTTCCGCPQLHPMRPPDRYRPRASHAPARSPTQPPSTDLGGYLGEVVEAAKGHEARGQRRGRRHRWRVHTGRVAQEGAAGHADQLLHVRLHTTTRHEAAVSSPH